jgi:hypothetical protein
MQGVTRQLFTAGCCCCCCRWIDLSNNQLSGALELPAVPRDQERLLVLLNLSGNKLTGEVARGAA